MAKVEQFYQYDFTQTAEEDEVDYTKQSKQFSLYSVPDKSQADAYSLTYGTPNIPPQSTPSAIKFEENYSQISASKTDWNTKFQSIIEELSLRAQKADVKDIQSQRQLAQAQVNASSKLRELCSKFGEEATIAAQIIVNEKSFPVEKKTIKPSDIGGLAGGTKFIFGNIILKFAVDNHGIYGGNDELIMKVANQELLSLVSLIECNVTGLFFPLMAIVDYHGYRMIASSLLPINRDTLVYGSADAGLNVFDKHPEAKAKIQQACTRLNLKPHKYEDVEFYGPVDMEVHVGKDNRLYVIDTSRLFPPTQPIAKNLLKRSGQLLAYHFRPQVLKKLPFPISSDAMSGFGHDNKEKHNVDVLEATKILIEEMIPACLAEITKKEYEYRSLSIGAICRKIHQFGINLRYLGVMRRMTKSPTWKNILLLAMIARAAKSELRKEWRNINKPPQSQFNAKIPMLKSEAKSSQKESKKKEDKMGYPKPSQGPTEYVDPDIAYKAAVAKYVTTFMTAAENSMPPKKPAKTATTLMNTPESSTPPAKSQHEWTTIKKSIQWKFVDGLTDKESQPEYDLRQSLPSHREWLMPLTNYFLKIVGAKLIFQDILSIEREQYITQSHVAKLEAKTKHMSFVLRDEGIAKVDLAKYSLGDGSSLNYLTDVSLTLKDASTLKSGDLEITKYRGINLILLAEYSLDPVLATKYLTEGLRHLEKSIAANEKDLQANLYKVHALFQLAMANHKLKPALYYTKDEMKIFPEEIKETLSRNLEKKIENLNPGATEQYISQVKEHLVNADKSLQQLLLLQKELENNDANQLIFNEARLLMGEILLEMAKIEQKPKEALSKAKEAVECFETVEPSKLVSFLRSRLARAHSAACLMVAKALLGEAGEVQVKEIVTMIGRALDVLKNAFESSLATYDRTDYNILDTWNFALNDTSTAFADHPPILEVIKEQQLIFESCIHELMSGPPITFQLSVSAASIPVDEDDAFLPSNSGQKSVEIRIQASGSKGIPFLKSMDFDFHPSIPMPFVKIIHAPFVVSKICEGSSTLTVTMHFPAAICPKGVKFNFLLSSEQTLKRNVYDVDLKEAVAKERKEVPLSPPQSRYNTKPGSKGPIAQKK